MFLSPNEIAALQKKRFDELRIQRLKQVRERAKVLSAQKVGAYTNLKAERCARETQLMKTEWECQKQNIIRQLSSVQIDIGKGHEDARQVENAKPDLRKLRVDLEMARAKDEIWLNNIAVEKLRKPGLVIDKRYMEIERERARNVARGNALFNVQSIPLIEHVEKTSSRQLGARVDFSNTAYHRVVAVKASAQREPAHEAAATATAQTNAEMERCLAMNARYSENAADRYQVAIDEITRQKVSGCINHYKQGRTQLMSTLRDLRTLDFKRKQENSLSAKHSLKPVQKERKITAAFESQFVSAVDDTKVGARGKPVRAWTEETSQESIRFIKF